MPPLFEVVTDLAAGVETLRRRSYGVIETADGRLRRIVLRPLPKLVSLPSVVLGGALYHRFFPGDGVFLYYHQPRRARNFLVLKYMVSSRQTSFCTFCRALAVLDEIARIKRSDALLCDASNLRISRRLLAREGWQPHCPSRWHRHYIKRFYGEYPAPPSWIAEIATSEAEFERELTPTP